MKKKGNLIFFLNRQCPVGCASCNAGVSTGKSAELTPQWLVSFFNPPGLPEFSGYIIWTGGEPFLSISTLEKGIELAAQKKYQSEILTSGIWFAKQPGILETLANKGSFSLRISLDAEHQKTVPLSLIISLIKKSLDLGIETNFTLREIPGSNPLHVDDLLTEIGKQLPEFHQANHSRSRWVHRIPHMPIAPEVSGHSLCNSGGPPNQQWKKKCKMGFNDLVIGEDGLLYPCCGLFGVKDHPRLAVGDPLKESWPQLDSKQVSNPLFQALKTKGPYGICKDMGLDPESWDWPPFKGPCHLCLALFYKHGEKIKDAAGGIKA
ncbi:MAG: hypothetical protein GY757_03745 [bacterium]|nr:hypothetical protein [bacterium]